MGRVWSSSSARSWQRRRRASIVNSWHASGPRFGGSPASGPDPGRRSGERVGLASPRSAGSNAGTVVVNLDAWQRVGLALDRPLRLELSREPARSRPMRGTSRSRSSCCGSAARPATRATFELPTRPTDPAAQRTWACATTGAGGSSSSSAGTRSATSARRCARRTGSSAEAVAVRRPTPGRRAAVRRGTAGGRPRYDGATGSSSRATRTVFAADSRARPDRMGASAHDGGAPPDRAGPRVVRRARDAFLRMATPLNAPPRPSQPGEVGGGALEELAPALAAA